MTACTPSPCTSPTVNASYQYDPLGRRTRKSGTGVTERYFLSDGSDEIAEYDASKSIVAYYVPGPAIDQPVVMVTGSSGSYVHNYFHANHQGSVVAATTDDGSRTDGPIRYDPYGQCVPASQCNALTLYRFTGRRLDPETGLLYYRARYYDPAKGRFLQTDPVGYTADLNLYTYVGNDPTNKADPTGRMLESNGGSDSECGPQSGGTKCYAGAAYEGGDSAGRKSQSTAKGQLQANGVEPTEEQNGRRGGLIDTDPLGPVRSAMFYSNLTAIRRLDPTMPLSVLSAPGEYASEEAVEVASQRLDAVRSRVSEEIGRGHAFGKHASDFGATTPEQMISAVRSVISDPYTVVRSLSFGRTAFYDYSTNRLVIVNPGGPDYGTAFAPSAGARYFETLQ